MLIKNRENYILKYHEVEYNSFDSLRLQLLIKYLYLTQKIDEFQVDFKLTTQSRRLLSNPPHSRWCHVESWVYEV
jgi:hypothetical protein